MASSSHPVLRHQVGCREGGMYRIHLRSNCMSVSGSAQVAGLVMAKLPLVRSSMILSPYAVISARGGWKAAFLEPKNRRDIVQIAFGTFIRIGMMLVTDQSVSAWLFKSALAKRPLNRLLIIVLVIFLAAGGYCSKDANELDDLVPTGWASNYWDLKTLAECCRNHYPLPESFRLCMGYPESSATRPPCSPSPWGRMSKKWYFLETDGICVRECASGDSCCGQALTEELYESFNNCCQIHLSSLDNSPCPPCSATFWEEYLSSSSALEQGFFPVCK